MSAPPAICSPVSTSPRTRNAIADAATVSLLDAIAPPVAETRPMPAVKSGSGISIDVQANSTVGPKRCVATKWRAVPGTLCTTAQRSAANPHPYATMVIVGSRRASRCESTTQNA